MREFNVKGLDRPVLEETYAIVLTQKLVLEAKLDRIKKEMAVAACAIDDGVAEINDARNGLLNLIAYIEAKTSLPDELRPDLGSLELVNKHLDQIREFAKNGPRTPGQ